MRTRGGSRLLLNKESRQTYTHTHKHTDHPRCIFGSECCASFFGSECCSFHQHSHFDRASNRDGFSRSGSGTCSRKTWGTRHFPCSLFPVPCSLKDSPPPKNNFAASNLASGGPAGHKTPLREHVFRVPCSLSPYGKTHPWPRIPRPVF